MRPLYVLRYRIFAAALVPALLALVTSCGGAKKVSAKVPGAQGRATQKFSIQVNVADAANQNYPIAMDLVAVADKKVVAEIGKLSAKDWFDRRTQVLRDYQGNVSVASWEWVPGQHAGPISVEIAPKTRVAYVFANYINAGGHRALVDVKAPVVVNLGPEDFSIQPLR
jgi:hypothetical protein